MKHYVYRITNIKKSKHYYGVRSATNPYKDLGVKYFSSSTDTEFINDQKRNPSSYKYKILFIYDTRKQAAEKEILIHEKMNVGISPNFYNKARATSTGFSPLGYKHTKESKLKIAEAGRRPCKKSTKIKISESNKNRFVSNETREKNAKANTGVLCNKFKGYYIYNGIKYITSSDLSADIGLSESKIKTVSKDLNKLISYSSYSKTSFLKENFNEKVIGKSWKDIGFNFINITK